MFLLVPETYHFYGKRTKRESEGSVLITNEKHKKTHTQEKKAKKRNEEQKAIRMNMQYIVAPSYTIRAGHGIVYVYLCTF